MANSTSGPWWAVASQATNATTAPVLQIAADGSWETAEVIAVAGDSPPARAVVERACGSARRGVGVEVLWPGQTFVGVGWPAAQWRHAIAGIARAYRVLREHHRAPVVEAGLLALLGSAPDDELECAELGAVNAWQSVGPEVLWRRGDRLARGAIDAVLGRRPDLTTCAYPLAVEFSVSRPRLCWIGVVVSTGSDHLHRLDPHALESILDRIVPGGVSASSPP